MSGGARPDNVDAHRPIAGVIVLSLLAGSLAVVQTAGVVAATTELGANSAWILANLSEAQRVGQLIMVAASLDGVSQETKSAIGSDHVGSVILTGRSTAGVTTVLSMTQGLQGLATTAATGGVPLFIATDQEGGYVQALSGPGFDTIPTALRQGKLAPNRLRIDATRWGGQLAAAGVNLNLAPVLDTVPPDKTSTNQPIGIYDREYGTNPTTVATAGTAFIQGMHVAGVGTAVKHFPGLGQADGDTDSTVGVTDHATTRHDPYIVPFDRGLGRAGGGVVMVSLATYTRIDPNRRAVFSPTVLDGMLRGDLGFTGVIMSDSMDAAGVNDLTPGHRAVRFVRAGGDLVLTTQPSDVPAMVSALLDKTNSDSAFRARVNASCLRVLIAKQRAGLLPGAIATAASGGRLYVGEQDVGADIGLYARAAGTWTGPISLDADTDRAPALSRIPGTDGVEVAEVTRSRDVAVRPYMPGEASGSWRGLGGAATSPPGVAVSARGRVAAAVRGPGLGIRLREYRPSVGWGTWTSLGGAAADAAPALVYTPAGDLDVFVLGPTQAIRLDVRHDGRWSGWQGLGGKADSAPALAIDAATGAITLFVVGIHATLWQQTVGSTVWVRVPHIRCVTAPAAAATLSGRVTVIAEGLDGRLRIARHTASGWSRWSVLPFD
jgi:beta-N-acetylhexosaminidase